MIKPSTDERIKQLCCLGLGGETIMPRLLKELHAVIPSYSNNFFWMDECHELTNMCFEDPVNTQVAPLFISEFYKKREAEVYLSFQECGMHLKGVSRFERLLKVDITEFYRHDFYNLIYRAVNGHHWLIAAVREGAQCLGLLVLFRAEADPEFSQEEEKRLSNLLPFIAHGLTAGNSLQPEWVDGDEGGLIILNTRGEVEHSSSHARKLLFLAVYPHISPASINLNDRDLPITTNLIRLCKRLKTVFEGDHDALPPVWQHRNTWGTFTFRAYWLHDTNPAGPSHIGVTVIHQMPLPVYLMNKQEKLPLSPSQKELCLLLASGQSYAMIGARLGISETQAMGHSKCVYSALRARDRKQFIENLKML